jgi:hypothetical protein
MEVSFDIPNLPVIHLLLLVECRSHSRKILKMIIDSGLKAKNLGVVYLSLEV